VTRRDNHGFTHIVRFLCWRCCLWSSKRMAAVRKSRLLLTWNSCSLRLASFTSGACINGIFVAIIFFATYDDTKGSTFEETDCGRRTDTCLYGARTIVHIARAPWGNHVNITRCPYSDRRNHTGLVRFFWRQKISQNRKATILSPYGNRVVSVRRPYDSAYDGFTCYDAYSES